MITWLRTTTNNLTREFLLDGTMKICNEMSYTLYDEYNLDDSLHLPTMTVFSLKDFVCTSDTN